MEPYSIRSRLVGTLLVAAGALAVASVAAAQEPADQSDQERGWTNVADVGLVATAGNSSTRTFQLDNRLVGRLGVWTIVTRVGGVRARNEPSRFAVGMVDSFVVTERAAEAGAERYYARGELRRAIRPESYWVAGTSWTRDRDAGVDRQVVVHGGYGNLWWERDDRRLASDYAVTFTDRLDDVDDSLRDQSFAGLRISVDHRRDLSATATFGNELIFLANLQDGGDRHLDWQSSLTSSLTDTFALRVGLQLLHSSMPALERLDLFDGMPGQGGIRTGSILARKKRLDTLLRVALVVTLS